MPDFPLKLKLCFETRCAHFFWTEYLIVNLHISSLSWLHTRILTILQRFLNIWNGIDSFKVIYIFYQLCQFTAGRGRRVVDSILLPHDFAFEIGACDKCSNVHLLRPTHFLKLCGYGLTNFPKSVPMISLEWDIHFVLIRKLFVPF